MSLLAIFLLLLLLWFPALSIQGAQQGLLLWFQVVLPTLAPFLICTQAIVALGGIHLLIRPVYPLFRVLFGLSPSGAYVLLCGMLCGYPLGARLCAQFQMSGRISMEEARYLFAICNHPSPMFLLGYVCGQLPFAVHPVFLLLCLYLPILPISMAARLVYGIPHLQSTPKELAQNQRSHFALEELIASACETMVLIGGYIMLFSILAVWISRLPGISDTGKALLIGLTEITTGIHQLCIGLPHRDLLPILAAVTAFGGLSGIFQTKSVIKNAGLSIRHYVGWKAIHALLSLILTLILLGFLPHW